jgi:hypothetical protein
MYYTYSQTQLYLIGGTVGILPHWLQIHVTSLFVLFPVKYFPFGKLYPIETADATRSISRNALI